MSKTILSDLDLHLFNEGNHYRAYEKLGSRAATFDGEPGLHYLCAGYKKFFKHIRKYLRAMTTLLENDLPVSAVMRAVDGPLIITKGARLPPPVVVANKKL